MTNRSPDWATQRVMNTPGFESAGRILELGAGDISRGISVAAAYPLKSVVTSDYELNAKAREAFAGAADLRNLSMMTVDARDSPFRDRYFDFIFSVALMEHVAELEDCLQEMYRILSPGGYYFYIQAPFWSCSQGHHFLHWDERVYDYVPKYSHLTMNEAEMRTHLEAGPTPFFAVDHCLEQIYRRPDLSRLTRDETRSLVEAGPLEIVSWEDYEDRRFDRKLARQAIDQAGLNLSLEQMRISGAYVLLRKPS